jgi:hypothetical protein
MPLTEEPLLLLPHASHSLATQPIYPSSTVIILFASPFATVHLLRFMDME